jgi:hypothetical protein
MKQTASSVAETLRERYGRTHVTANERNLSGLYTATPKDIRDLEPAAKTIFATYFCRMHQGFLDELLLSLSLFPTARAALNRTGRRVFSQLTAATHAAYYTTRKSSIALRTLHLEDALTFSAHKTALVACNSVGLSKNHRDAEETTHAIQAAPAR